MARKAYRSEKITVSFDLQRCIHARECIRDLSEVCATEKRPWTQPDKAQPDAVTTVVRAPAVWTDVTMKCLNTPGKGSAH